MLVKEVKVVANPKLKELVSQKETLIVVIKEAKIGSHLKGGADLLLITRTRKMIGLMKVKFQICMEYKKDKEKKEKKTRKAKVKHKQKPGEIAAYSLLTTEIKEAEQWLKENLLKIKVIG